MDSTLSFIIAWIPTILFCLILFFGFIKGLIRGYRKSKISLIHSLVAGGLCIVLFFLLTNLEFFDKLVLDIVNSFAGNIQSQLGVSESITTFRGVLAEYIPLVITESDPALGSAFASNSSYLIALVNFVYNFVGVIVCYVVYLTLRILLYLIYFIFYPERRYKKKWNRKYKNGTVAHQYKKRRFRGAVLSLCVSFLSAIVFFSFFGNFLFVFAGSGDSLPEHEFSDASTNETYQVISKIEGYSENGIFKLLNLAKDSNGVPLYLYVSGLFYSSEYDNPLTGEKDRVYLTHELGSYVSFIKETASLVLKYEGDCFEEIISGSEEFSKETLVKILSNEDFRKEYRELIADFSNNSSFVSNFVFSMLNSYAENLDKSTMLDDFSPEAKEILKIMFVKGYKSPYIEYEKNYEGDDLPYVKPSYLVSKQDLLVAYDVFCELIDVGIFNKSTSPIQIIEAVSPFVKELTLFNDKNENRKEINGVMSRIYSYFEVQMTGIDSSEAIANYTKNKQVNWVEELIALTEISPDICALYDVIDDGIANNKSTEKVLECIFANEKNLKSYDNILDFIVSSKIAATAFSNDYIKNEIEIALSDAIPNLVISDSLVFENTYDDNGQLKEYGELYYLLSSIKSICKDSNGRKLIDNLTSGQKVDFIYAIKSSKTAFSTKDSVSGLSALDCLAESELLRSVASAFLIDLAKDESSVIYISDYALEINKDEVLTSLIKKEEYTMIINSLFDIMDLLPSDISSSDDVLGDIISTNGNLFDNQTLMTLIKDSVIIQGTIGKLIVDLANQEDSTGDFISLSDRLSSVDGWISYNGSTSEVFKFITTLDTVFGDSKVLTNFDDTLISSLIQKLSVESNFNAVMDCEFLRYSISNITLTALKDSGLFDSTVIDSCVGEDGLIKNIEIKSIIDFVNFSEIKVVDGIFDNLNNYTDDITLITKIRQTEEEFEGYSLLDISYNSTIIKDYINSIIDSALVNFVSRTDLDKCKENNYYTKNELNYLINSLAEIGVSNINLSDDQLTDKVSKAFVSLNETSSIDSTTTKLNYVYKSNIIKLIITKKLDETISASSNMQNHPEAKEFNTVLELNVYKESEISQLASLLDLMNLDSIDSVSVNELKINDLLTEYYSSDYSCESKLLLSILSHNVLNFAGNAIVVPSTAYSINNTEYKILKDKESYILIDFCSSVLGADATVGKIESNLSSSINDLSLTNVSDFYLGGDIIRATLSDALINDSSLIIPAEVLQNADDVQMITFGELSSLLDICSAVGLTSISDLHTDVSVKVEDLDLISIKNYVNLSKILQASVSNKILSNSNIVVPVKDLISVNGVDQISDIVTTDSLNISMISLFEFNALLTALDSVGVHSLQVAKTITVDTLNPATYYTDSTKVSAIASSSILRATITEHMDLGDEVHSIALRNEVVYGDNVKDFTGNKIAILKYYEVEHLLVDVGIYKDENNSYDIGSANPFNCSIDYSLIYKIYLAGDLHEMLQSDIFRIAVSEVLIKNGASIESNKVDAYVIDTHDDTFIASSCESQAIEDYFDSLPSIS